MTLTLNYAVHTMPLLTVASAEAPLVADLRALRAWFSETSHWTQQNYGITFPDENGVIDWLAPFDIAETYANNLLDKTCLLGGVYLQAPNSARRRLSIICALARGIKRLDSDTYATSSEEYIIGYNDDPERTAEDIVNLIDLVVAYEVAQ
jgi:hypothetical protein